MSDLIVVNGGNLNLLFYASAIFLVKAYIYFNAMCGGTLKCHLGSFTVVCGAWCRSIYLIMGVHENLAFGIEKKKIDPLINLKIR